MRSPRRCLGHSIFSDLLSGSPRSPEWFNFPYTGGVGRHTFLWKLIKDTLRLSLRPTCQLRITLHAERNDVLIAGFRRSNAEPSLPSKWNKIASPDRGSSSLTCLTTKPLGTHHTITFTNKFFAACKLQSTSSDWLFRRHKLAVTDSNDPLIAALASNDGYLERRARLLSLDSQNYANELQHFDFCLVQFSVWDLASSLVFPFPKRHLTSYSSVSTLKKFQTG
jgi:hypothetical protein